MRLFKSIIVLLCLASLLFSVAACDSDDGGAEKAGKKIDQAVDDAKDAAKKMFE